MVERSKLSADVEKQLNELSEIARRGRSSTVNAGSLMLIWGGAIAAAGSCEMMSQDATFTVAAWIVPIFLAYILSLIAVRLSQSDGRSVTWRSRAIYKVWIAAGAAIVIFNVGEELRHTGLQSESEAATALILSVAALATAELASQRLLLAAGVGWLCVASALFMIPNDRVLSLLTYAAILLQIVPGIVLVREEWKA